MINPAVQAAFNSRQSLIIRWFLWIKAADGGGTPTPVGLWTGGDNVTITLEGESRTYYGAQGALNFSPFQYIEGAVIQTTTVSISVTPEAENFVRGYRTQYAPADIHRAVYNASTGVLIGTDRMFKGFLDTIAFPTPEVGGEQQIELEIMSSARLGTMTSNLRKSDAAQRLRLATDTFRKDGDMGNAPADIWGAGDMDPARTPAGTPYGGPAPGAAGAPTPRAPGVFG